MSRNEIGMEMSFDNMLDRPAFTRCRFNVDVYVPLGIHDGRHALRRDHVGGVGQAAQIESFHLYRFHAFSWTKSSSTRAAERVADTAGPRSSLRDTSELRLH